MSHHFQAIERDTMTEWSIDKWRVLKWQHLHLLTSAQNILKFIPIHLCVARNSIDPQSHLNDDNDLLSLDVYTFWQHEVKTCEMNGISLVQLDDDAKYDAAVALIVLFICKQVNIPIFRAGVT